MKNKREQLPARECPICGKLFIPKAKHRIYCYPEYDGTVECSKRAMYKKDLAESHKNDSLKYIMARIENFLNT